LGASSLLLLAIGAASAWVHVSYWTRGPWIQVHAGLIQVAWLRNNGRLQTPSTQGWRAGFNKQRKIVLWPDLWGSHSIGPPFTVHGVVLPL
jgi:hypothetical protein